MPVRFLPLVKICRVRLSLRHPSVSLRDLALMLEIYISRLAAATISAAACGKPCTTRAGKG